jgi:hypothetical protein
MTWTDPCRPKLRPHGGGRSPRSARPDLRIRSVGACPRHITGPPDASKAIQNVSPSQEVGLLICPI